MSDAITVTTNAGFLARRFERYLQRSIQIGRRSVEIIVREQARGLVKHAFLYTPPMAGRSFFQGKKASQNAIAATIVKATVVKNLARVERQLSARRSNVPQEQLLQMQEQLKMTPSQMAQKIRSNRRPDKHYPDAGPKFYVTKQTRKQLRHIFEMTMGATAAGWCYAADKLGVIYPDWIGRWSSSNSGTATFQTTNTLVEFKAKNPNRHRDSRSIQRALDSAYDAQAGKMRNRLISAISAGVLRREDVFIR